MAHIKINLDIVDVFSDDEMIILTGGKFSLFGINIVACGDGSPFNGSCPVEVNNNVPQCGCTVTDRRGGGYSGGGYGGGSR